MSINWQTALADDLQKLSETVSSRVHSETRLKRGERRSVAVLFLDLKGFTELSENLDHEIVYELVGGVMKALSGVVEGYGGYVDKIEGDRIMALFGAKQAAENDSIRAVACGLKMAETIDGVNRMLAGRDIELGFRAGVSSGSVTVAPDALGHLTATGDTVNLASRMEETARPNSIQVTQEVRDECGDEFRWEDLGEITVKGRREPVRTSIPTGPGEVQTERCDRASRIACSPLVGRTGEMLFLRCGWEDLLSEVAGKGPRGVHRHMIIGVSGEAGIGKSRLVHEFLQGIRDSGRARVLQGRSISYGQPAYRLWSTLLESAFRKGRATGEEPESLSRFLAELASGIDDDRAAKALLDSRPYLAGISLPGRGGALAVKLDDETVQKETPVAVRNLLRALACTGRLVLVLEDLHWIDEASRNVLDFVLSNCDLPSPMLVLCLYRPDPEGAARSAAESAGEYVEFREIQLEPVDQEGGRELISHLLRSSCAGEIEEFVLHRSMGNPLFIEEMILDLVESGLIVETDRGWCFLTTPGSIYVPDSLSGLVRSRLDRFSPSTRENLQICSVLGCEFSGSLFTSVWERLDSIWQGEDPLEDLVDKGFLTGNQDTCSYSFRHVMIHDVVYDTLLHHNRRTLHRLAAEALEEAHSADSDRVAASISAHWENAGCREEAIDWGIRAVNEYKRTYQTSQGLSLTGKLDGWLQEKEPDRNNGQKLLEMLFCRNAFLNFTGMRQEQGDVLERMLQIARMFGLRHWQCRILRLKGLYLDQTSGQEMALECYREALEISREERERDLEGSLLKAIAGVFMDQGRMDEASEYLDRAVRISIETGNRKAEAIAVCTLGILHRIRGRIDEAQDCYEQALEIQRELGDRWQEGVVLCCIGIVHAFRRRWIEAREFFREALSIAEETGNRVFQGSMIANLAGVFLEEGSYREAIDMLMDSLEIHRETGDTRQVGLVLGRIGTAYSLMGEKDRALDFFGRAIVIHREVKNLRSEAYVLGEMAHVYRTRGESARVTELLSEALEISAKVKHRNLEAELLVQMGEFLLAEGDPDKAVHYYTRAVNLTQDHDLAIADSAFLPDLRKRLLEHGVAEGEVPLPVNWSDSDDDHFSNLRIDRVQF